MAEIFMSLDPNNQIFVTRYSRDATLYFCVRNGPLANNVFLHKLYLFSINLDFSFMKVWESWCILLYISVARTCRFLLWTETELSLNVEDLSSETIRNTLSWIQLTWLFKCLMQKPYKRTIAKQWTNECFFSSFFFFFFWTGYIKKEIQAKVLSFWLALSQIPESCSSTHQKLPCNLL